MANRTPVHLRPSLQSYSTVEEYGRKLTEFAQYTQSMGVQVAYRRRMGTVNRK